MDFKSKEEKPRKPQLNPLLNKVRQLGPKIFLSHWKEFSQSLIDQCFSKMALEWFLIKIKIINMYSQY